MMFRSDDQRSIFAGLPSHIQTEPHVSFEAGLGERPAFLKISQMSVDGRGWVTTPDFSDPCR
jgi:hypothetical protein